MARIALLSQETIDKIAAGEVIERPSSVVKELVENAIDAGASAITVEIKEGGISFIRITDNGSGIESSQVPLAFLRHSTSKIQSVEDLFGIKSLGFRGEALSSIAAIARVELITKTYDQLTGVRYVIEGSKEISQEEVGAPDGTTFLVKDLFYNTPARRKFLKTPQTEGNYVHDLVEKLALSHPDISFKFIQNNQTKLHTSGNGNRKDLIYHVFGRDITSSVLEVDHKGEYFEVKGFIGKPVITRGNRNYENYFINGRYIKSNMISKAIEDAYKPYIMQHQYPFCVLYFTFSGELLDVNVHPTKMELRFEHNMEIYKELSQILYDILSGKELIPEVPVEETKEKKTAVTYKESIPEPFEKRRLNDIRKAVGKDSPYERKYPERQREVWGQSKVAERVTGLEHTKAQPASVPEKSLFESTAPNHVKQATSPSQEPAPASMGATINHDRTAPSRQPAPTLETSAGTPEQEPAPSQAPAPVPSQATAPVPSQEPADTTYEEMTLSDISEEFLSKTAREKHKIIGQLFDTYWLVQFEDKLYIIDQHAAHEKVLYERTMARLREKEYTSQAISPPIMLSLDVKEVEMLEKYRTEIEKLGYEIEHFGGREYTICGVPDNLFHMDMKDLFIEMLDDFSNLSGRQTPELILEKVASMSCKAAVKGNTKLSMPEIEALIEELLTLENPYNCPHGRPTIISMTKYEIEKKFKRIVS